MNHIIDETYDGHELIFLDQTDREDGIRGMITVDIRADNFEGGFLTGRSDFLNVTSARLWATGFIDGYHDAVGMDDCPHGDEDEIADNKKGATI